MRLRNITPTALHLWIYQIYYTDMIYMILVTGDWILISLSFVTLLLDQFWVYTRRCPLRKSARHLAWRSLGNSLPLDFPKKYNRFNKLFYSDWLFYFSNQGSLWVMALDTPFSVSVLLISTYERPQNMRVRELILENHDTMKWQLTLMALNWPIQN